MSSFEIGQRYTRDQVRASLGLQPMTGGDWATGYARHGDEIFVFCNVGVAGRTGHDYPNRWIDDALDWFGKGGSRRGQPMIEDMISGAVTTHVFWRGRDRAPFTYAGVGEAQGAWNERPVEVLWRFGDAPSQAAGATSPPQSRQRAASPRTAFQHGPPPSLGFQQMLTEDGECHLYLMVLEGPVDTLFPTLTPAATERTLIKVGMSRDPERRQRELNAGFPKGAIAGWRVRATRLFGSVADAYDAEGELLERLASAGRWLSGEFAIVPNGELDRLLEAR